MKKQSGFTIVELLVVIVVIGVLASITIISYSGISQKATAASLQSDLSNAATQLKNYYTDNGSYPTAVNCTAPGATEICIRPSGTNTFSNYASGGSYFNLVASNGNTTYYITDSTPPALFALSNSGGGIWSYKRQITITNSSSGNLQNYVVRVDISTASLGNPYAHIKSDGSDIRFTDNIGTIEYQYWNESWSNAGASTFWVKVPNLPNGSSNIYMYYGNNSATSSSNGDNTFPFFDDFNDNNYTNKWTVVSGAWTESGGTLTMNAANYAINSIDSSLNAGEYGVRSANLNGGGAVVMSLGSSVGSERAMIAPHNAGSLHQELWRGGSNIIPNPATSWSVDNNFHTNRVRTIKNLWQWVRDDLSKYNGTPTYTPNTTYIQFAGDGRGSYDWVYYRKYISPDPSVGVPGSEIAL